MLTFVPQALRTSNFRVLRSHSGEALLPYSGNLTKPEAITLGGVELTVVKHGTMSGHWSLERFGEIYADAQKPSALSSSFDLCCGDAHLTVKEQPDTWRCFHIRAGDSVVGTIRAVHLWTRRGIIECGASVPELAQLFAFWLVVRTWRRLV